MSVKELDKIVESLLTLEADLTKSWHLAEPLRGAYVQRLRLVVEELDAVVDLMKEETQCSQK